MAGQESPVFLAQGEHVRAHAVAGDPVGLSGRHRGLGTYPFVLGGLTYWSGVWATVFVLMALAVTPAVTIFRWPALVDVRRMIGVTALVYTIAHVVIYFAFRRWDVAFIANDMMRFTLILATLSTIGLIVLGATSVDAAIRYMGARNWQRLHTTTYVISGLAILHVLLARGTYAEQYMLTGIFFWVMGWRVLARYGLGASGKALTLLAVASCLVTALLEAGFMWGRRGFDVLGRSAIISPWRSWMSATRRHGRCSLSDSWSRSARRPRSFPPQDSEARGAPGRLAATGGGPLPPPTPRRPTSPPSSRLPRRPFRRRACPRGCRRGVIPLVTGVLVDGIRALGIGTTTVHGLVNMDGSSIVNS